MSHPTLIKGIHNTQVMQFFSKFEENMGKRNDMNLYLPLRLSAANTYAISDCDSHEQEGVFKKFLWQNLPR